MEQQLREYLTNSKHLPAFMRDFHDQKTLFKRLGEMNESRKDKYTENVSWISAQVYTIDVFLWYMACHGYTLQKSRKRVPFYDLENDLNMFEKRQKEEAVSMLKKAVEKKDIKQNS